jgi:hypothetical protein
MPPSTKTKPVGWQVHFGAALLLASLLVPVSFLIGYFFPATNQRVLEVLQVRVPSLAVWVKLQPWADSSLVVIAVVALGLYIAVSLFFKIAGKRLWQWLTGKLAKRSTPDEPPAGCYALDTIANELFPQVGQGSPALSFVGRETEQQWLSKQCGLAKTSGGIRVVALWGPQGIGKTHLSYVFARDLTKGDYPSLGKWLTWRLDREFDPQAVVDGLPARPVMLLLDDVSLADDASHRRVQKLVRLGRSRQNPLLLTLTAWQPRLTEGLSLGEKLVDDELEVTPLGDQFAGQLFKNANLLPPELRGHPLMLRLLDQLPSTSNPADAPTDVWAACLAWASGFVARLRRDYGMSDKALQAFAAVSSSDAVKWQDLLPVFKLEDADFQSLQKTGRVSDRQGAVSVAPLRPDLLGWAFAIQVFKASHEDALQPYASLAWATDFFDTGRFLQFATTHQLAHNPWVSALRAPPMEAAPALSRARAAINAVNHYGSSQNWPDMADQLRVSEAIAQRFSDNAEIQLSRAMAASNAVNHYGSAQIWPDMADQLRVSEAIAQRFSDNAEIQLSRAKAATNAVNHYGSAQNWPDMADQLRVSEAIAQRFSDNAEIQLSRAKAAINAVTHYGSAQNWPDMADQLRVSEAIAQRFSDNAEIQLSRAMAAFSAVTHHGIAWNWPDMADQLRVSEAIAQRFSGNAEIQLVRAQAAFNAVSVYGSSQNWPDMAIELAISQAIAQRFSGNAEIQLSRANAATNAVNHYGSAQNWPDMAAELRVSEAIAQRFSGNAEIQLSRAKAATNAVTHYGSAQNWPAMAAELMVTDAIAQRFSGHEEIQLPRANAAANAVNQYGEAQNWSAMAAELVVAEAIAQRFSDNEEIQLSRAVAAANAVTDYGDPEKWVDMAVELAVSAAIAQRFSGNKEIQLRHALCLLARFRNFHKFGMGSGVTGQPLLAHLQLHPYLHEMPPFDQWDKGS